MKYYYQLGNILNKKQKKEAIYLTFLTFVATILEVISLNFLLVLLGSMSGSASFKDDLSPYISNFGSYGFHISKVT